MRNMNSCPVCDQPTESIPCQSCESLVDVLHAMASESETCETARRFLLAAAEVQAEPGKAGEVLARLGVVPSDACGGGAVEIEGEWVDVRVK